MYDKMTETEKSIIYLIGKGFTNEEIAENIGKAKGTVSTYIFHLYTYIKERLFFT